MRTQVDLRSSVVRTTSIHVRQPACCTAPIEFGRDSEISSTMVDVSRCGRMSFPVPAELRESIHSYALIRNWFDHVETTTTRAGSV